MGNTVVEKSFVVGDRRTPIADTLTDEAGTAINLTGCTVAFRMIGEDATVKVNNSAAVIDSAADGQVSYLWQAADVDTAGKYFYWWIVTVTASGKVEHFPGDGRKRLVIFHPNE